MSRVEIVPRPDEDRFEVQVDGARAGHTEYVRKGDLVIFTHTEIDPAYEGQGIGSTLARGALDAVRAAGDPIVPLCPFIAGFVEKHPEYDDLVDHECLDFLESRARRRRTK
jgi:hypothetical protein